MLFSFVGNDAIQLRVFLFALETKISVYIISLNRMHNEQNGSDFFQ